MLSSGRPAAPPRRRIRLGLGAAVILLLAALAIAVLISALGSHGTTTSVADASPLESVSAAPGDGSAGGVASRGDEIFVHIVGAVAHPGLYSLHEGDRVVDVVAAAGGLGAKADQSQINLARVVSDGEKVVVPVVGAAPVTSGGGSGKVNLNTADLKALETLPRVGPAMAQRIIDWRTSNGRFAVVEDLMGVSGVGDKTFQQLKPLVTV